MLPRALPALTLAALLSACLAETVERRAPRPGPVPEVGFVDPGGGQVRYSTEGWSAVVAARRRDAMRLMRRACKGLPFKIVDELEREDADIPYNQGGSVTQIAEGHEHFRVAPYHHIFFECQAPRP